jgi:hypothetical protein
MDLVLMPFCKYKFKKERKNDDLEKELYGCNIKKLSFFRIRVLIVIMVPKKGLEPLHLSAYAPQAYMSTIPSPGHFFWIYKVQVHVPLAATNETLLLHSNVVPLRGYSFSGV